MNMTKCMIAGLPGSGKSTYIGALWYCLMHPDNIEFLDRVFGYLAATERGNVFTIDEKAIIEKNGRKQVRILEKKIKSDDDVFNIAFLEKLYDFIVAKNGNPIKVRFRLHKNAEIKYYDE